MGVSIGGLDGAIRSALKKEGWTLGAMIFERALANNLDLVPHPAYGYKMTEKPIVTPLLLI